MTKTYYLNLGGAPCTDNTKDFFHQRKANLKTTQVFWYAVGLDLSYAEYYIKHGAILIFLN